MKIYIRMPNGTEFHMERKPMSNERFKALCCLAGGVMVLVLFLAIVWAV